MSTSRNLTVLVLAAVMAGSAYAKGNGEDEKIRAEVQKQIDERPSLKFLRYFRGELSIMRCTLKVLSTRTLTAVRPKRSPVQSRGSTKVYDKLVLNGNGWPSARGNSQPWSTRTVDGQASAGD